MRSFKRGHIFSLDGVVFDPDQEHIDTLYSNRNTRIKRILSKGHVTPPGQWYDQKEDEWVMLMQGNASLEFEDGSIIHLRTGDYIVLDAGTKHRVSYTSNNPPCIWLAVYVEL